MREKEAIIQPLEIEDNCLGVFYKDTFYFERHPEILLKSNTSWNYSHILGEDEAYRFLKIFAKGVCLSEYSSDPGSYRSLEQLIKAQKDASTTAKIDFSELCFFDILPDHLLYKWFSARDEAMSRVQLMVQKPEDYDILHKIHVVTTEISKKTITSAGTEERVAYDIFSSATGRLATAKHSFPILSISKEERNKIQPKNDLFLELDVNGAEIRTLLAFSGAPQPEVDIHEWNMKSMAPWVTRAEAKEKFFAWLYNPKSENKEYEKFYNKKAYLEHYNAGCIATPFGRRLPVDERRALNYLLQSTTSDIVLDRSYEIMKLLKNKRSYVAFTMHDSVVLDFAKEDSGLVRSIKDTFETNMFGKFLSTVSIGKDFGNLRKIET